MAMKILSVACGMIAANYLWQGLTVGDWPAAHERSFFQAMALFSVWLVSIGRES
jgi:hypothetical protein